MKKLTVGLLVTLTSASLATLGYTSYAKPMIPYAAENTYQTVNNHGNINLYPDLRTLFEKADLVAEVQIQEQDTLQVSDSSVETRSKANVKEILKGDNTFKKIAITEYGGIRDLSTMKGNENRSDPNNLPKENKGFVEVTLEGSTVMKPNQKYIVFLYKTNTVRPGTPVDGFQDFTPVGVIQGKIKVDEKDMLISTVDPELVKHNKEAFTLTHSFAGKNKKALTDEILKVGKQ